MWTIRNNYSGTIQVCIMYYSPNCRDGGNWAKKGWWSIPPGGSKVVYGPSMRGLNRYFCYYDIHRAVPPQAFDWCEWTANTQSRNLGFRVLDINSYDNYTLSLFR
jgi:Protein of unknown function (DUF1036)